MAITRVEIERIVFDFSRDKIISNRLKAIFYIVLHTRLTSTVSPSSRAVTNCKKCPILIIVLYAKKESKSVVIVSHQHHLLQRLMTYQKLHRNTLYIIHFYEIIEHHLEHFSCIIVIIYECEESSETCVSTTNRCGMK